MSADDIRSEEEKARAKEEEEGRCEVDIHPLTDTAVMRRRRQLMSCIIDVILECELEENLDLRSCGRLRSEKKMSIFLRT